MRSVLVLSLGVLIQSCGLKDYKFQSLVYDFAASPAQVEYGQTSTLSWKLGGRVTTLTLNGESVMGTTSKIVSPVRRQTFALAASNSLVPTARQEIVIAARGLDLLAGTVGGRGYMNGTGNEARFSSPAGLVVDSSGDVYVADAGNHVIRKVTAQGMVTRFAGFPGLPGYVDGTDGASRLNYPNGVAVFGRSAGQITYVADSGSNTIRRINANNVVRTIAGSGRDLPGSAEGTGDVARFNNPRGVAVDASGMTLYVADSGNHTIRRVALSVSVGTVSTIAGSPGAQGFLDGDGNSARFNFPTSLAVDGQIPPVIYVADLGNHCIRRITWNSGTGWSVSTFAGAPPPSATPDWHDGIGSAARFNSPNAVALDRLGNLFVADTYNHLLRRVTISTGEVSTVAGLPFPAGTPASTDGIGQNARFNVPQGVTVDDSGSNVYVAEGVNHTIRKVVTSNWEVSTLAGFAGNGAADGAGSAALFNSPQGVAVDGSGTVYVADSANQTLRKITLAGAVSLFAGAPGVSGPQDGIGPVAHFANPLGVAVDGSGNIYVADSGNNNIRKVTRAGEVSTLAGSPQGQPEFADGTGASARFDLPSGLGVDGSGNIYVADTLNHIIRKVTPEGVASTLAGSPGRFGSSDGTRSAASFNFPFAVAVEGSGNVYVADSGNNTIRKVTPDGTVSTMAGSAQDPAGSTDGTGPLARFNGPSGLALDRSGNIYVADYQNHAIRKVTPAGAVTTVAGTASTVTTSTGTVAPGALPALLSFPTGIALTPAGDLIVSSANGVLQITAP